MMFNEIMKNTQKLIDRLGGSSKVAEMLGWKNKPGQVQRIQNWKKRGIPARVLLEHGDLFVTESKAKKSGLN